MFSQDEIDAVLADAQAAVDDLSNDVQGLSAPVATAVASPAYSAPTPTGGTGARSAAMGGKPSRRVDRILKLGVTVRVRVAQRPMPLSEIVKITPGTILEFERNVDKELDLMVNNHQIGTGAAVKVNERFGIRITSIRTVKARIDSLRK